MITIKSEKEIQIMKEGGKLLARIMEKLEKEVRSGIITKYLDRVASDLVLKYGAKCSFKGYQNFPACLCTSLNEELVHCVPSGRQPREGDIISLDLGILYKGFHTDMAITVGVGKISPQAKKLIQVTKKALIIGIKKVRSGNTFGDIGNAIQRYVEGQGFNVIRELCGHGIGREIHEDPQILNYGKEGTGSEIKEGMVFCLEPMVTIGQWKIKKAKDSYGFAMKDNLLCAHFEQTIAITKNGCQILTELK